MKYKAKHIIYLVFVLILFSCTEQKDNSIVIFEDQIYENGDYKLIETINYDIDKDNLLDTIEIYKLNDWNDPGDFQKLLIKLSSMKYYKIYNLSDWVKFENEKLNGLPNKVSSNRILIAEVDNQKDLLIIQGYM